jgi:hypothetical protein
VISALQPVMMSVPIQSTPTFNPGTRRRRSKRYFTSGTGRPYDVSRDGQQFLMIKDNPSGDSTSTPAGIVVVLNWVEELKRA